MYLGVVTGIVWEDRWGWWDEATEGGAKGLYRHNFLK